MAFVPTVPADIYPAYTVTFPSSRGLHLGAITEPIRSEGGTCI